MLPYMNQALNNRDVSDYIRRSAIQRGIDPATALRVWGSEGRSGYVGDKGSSFGPFQLHYGGVASGGNRVAGLGDDFTKKTGLDARDPSTWKQQIDFSLDHAAKTGWGPWHGAAKIGLPNNAGIPSLVGSPAPVADPAPPMDAAIAAQPAPQETQSGGFDGMNSFGNALLGVSGALQNINNPGAGNSLLKMAMENSQTPKMQFRGFMPNGKGMMFTDARGNEQIRPVPEAYQGPKESDTPAEIRTLEALVQRPDLMKTYNELHRKQMTDGTYTDADIPILEEMADLYQRDKGAIARMGEQRRTQLMRYLHDKSITGRDVAAGQVEQASNLASGRQLGRMSTNIDTFAETFKGGADLAIKASTALPRGNWKAWNKISQMALDQIGDPAYADFAVKNNTVAIEYAKAMNPLSSTLNVSDVEHARNMLSTADSPEAYQAKIEAMRSEIERTHSRLKHMKDRFKDDISGRSEEAPKEEPPKEQSVPKKRFKYNPATGMIE